MDGWKKGFFFIEKNVGYWLVKVDAIAAKS